MLRRLKAWARRVRDDVLALGVAARDPRTPWAARALAVLIVAYALSPIDLIPDMIPVLGLLDDAVLLPLLILAAIRLVPPALMAEHRATAARLAAGGPSRRGRALGAALVVGLWLAGLGLVAWWFRLLPG